MSERQIGGWTRIPEGFARILKKHDDGWWDVVVNHEILRVKEDEMGEMLPHAPLLFKFSTNNSKPPPFMVCMLCRSKIEETFGCETCGQAWCSNECRAIAAKSGHTVLCSAHLVQIRTNAVHPRDPLQKTAVMTRSFPAFADPMEGIRQISMLGIDDKCAGAYFSTNTPSCRAGFINLQPLLSDYASKQLNDRDITTYDECIRFKNDLIAIKQRVMDEAFLLTSSTISNILEMVICSPSVCLFVGHGDYSNDKSFVEVVEIVCKPSQKVIESGITCMNLSWVDCDIFTRVYNITDRRGSRPALIGSLCRGQSPSIFTQEWVGRLRTRLNKAVKQHVNLGANEWSQETVQLADSSDVHSLLTSLDKATSKEEYKKVLQSSGMINVLEATLGSIAADMFHMEDVDFFLFPIRAENILSISQQHAIMNQTVHPVRMASPSEHQKKFPDTYADMKKHADELLGDRTGFVVLFEIHGRYGYVWTLKFWSVENLKNLLHDRSAQFERVAIQGRLEVCALCGKVGARMRCSRCKSAKYCSAACQRKDWKSHKPICERLIHHRRALGALRIQRLSRGWLVRREMRRRSENATRIQRYVRGRMARRELQKRLEAKRCASKKTAANRKKRGKKKKKMVEQASDTDTSVCVVCMEGTITWGFFHNDTVHQCLCDACKERVSMTSSSDKCPMCREAGKLVRLFNPH